MRSSIAATVLCFFGLSLAGCAAESASTEEGTLEGEVGATDDALAAPGQSTFYRVVRQDFRKCAWPMCGGVYVERVNRAKAQCADGTWQTECYVADFDWKALGLADSATFDAKVRSGAALVRGKIEARKVGPTTASTFVATEGWEARIEGATATGYFSRFTQRAVKCMSLACASYDLSYLNLSTSRPVHAFATKALPTDLVPEINAAFADGKIGVLVATTVVEVGVNVPNATIMVIEQAERFGLAQLHQLRGRVGRGRRESSCVLLYDPPLSETAQKRLDILRRTDDGFQIAETDLELRGGGDALGLKQSGFPAYVFADPFAHRDLIAVAGDDARLILARDPQLKSPRGQAVSVLQELFDWRPASPLKDAG